jgi:serine/threonine-protein kinase
MALPDRTHLGRYQILAPIGAGGMGEVYLAKDPVLGRKVALKCLAEALRERSDARRRFLLEAKASAALDHPYICKVYETGQDEGVPFIALEYVDGPSLQARLRDGPLPVPAALQIGAEIAEALEVAHGRGIIHRDLKPSNILLGGEGHAKVLDFGLARWLPEFQDTRTDVPMDTSSTLHSEGTAPGTPAYMAPEQLRRSPATPQSDIFSLGIVMFQMLTGVHPFLKPSAAETAEAIFHESEPPLGSCRGDTPELLQHVVRKMLAKDPGLRYQSAHEVRTDLLEVLHPSQPQLRSHSRPSPARRRWRVVAALLAPALGAVGLWGWLRLSRPHPPGGTAPLLQTASTSLAVLPFVDTSPGRDLEYFCDGITEQIISVLSGIDGLRVTARTSAFAFKGRNEDVREIGRKLGVGSLLEGSVFEVSGKLRITVRLVSASSGFELWSKTYERTLTDVLDIQNAIAGDVARQLEIHLGDHSALAVNRLATQDTEAYLLYLRGRFYWSQRRPASLDASLRYFQEALERDHGFALAYVGIADVYNVLEAHQRLSPREALSRAGMAVARALEIDDTLAEAHASQAALLERQWDWLKAEGAYRRALSLKPGDARIRCWYAQFLAGMGRHEEALHQTEQALLLDPLSSYVHSVHGVVLYLARRYPEALRQYTFTRDLDPEDPMVYEALGYLYANQARPEEALAAARRASELQGDATTSAVLGYANGIAGNQKEAREILGRLIALWEGGKGSPGGIALVYTSLGDRDGAFAWLETACREHDTWITLLKVEPSFDPLRPDAKFRELLRRIGLDD